MKELEKSWVEICDKYLLRFCERHDLLDAEIAWIETGELVQINDYFVSMGEIRYDVDNDVPPMVWEQYEDYCDRIRAIEMDYDLLFNPDRSKGLLIHMNYPSFCKGTPGYSEADFEKMEGEMAHMKKMTEEFHKEICASGK